MNGCVVDPAGMVTEVGVTVRDEMGTLVIVSGVEPAGSDAKEASILAESMVAVPAVTIPAPNPSAFTFDTFANPTCKTVHV